MTQMTLPVQDQASEKQITFITSLIAERELDSITRSSLTATVSTLNKKGASGLIKMLLALPKAAEKVLSVPAMSLQEALSKAPKSKYAIPASECDIMLEGTSITGDLLFLEIREYMGSLYMRRLTGSVGGFTRHRVPNKDATALVNLISQDPYKYTKLFGQHYSCCGSCGAELTDPVSRDLQLGPECRKKFGR